VNEGGIGAARSDATSARPSPRFPAWYTAAATRIARAGRAAARRIDQPTIGLVALLAFVWVSHMSLPLPTATPGLDASWRQVLGYAITHGWQAGRDFVFTFGPLGYFNPAPYDPALFWTKVIGWEIAFKLVLTSYLVIALRRMGSTLEKAIYVLVLLLLFPGDDAYFFTVTVAIVISIVHSGERLRLRDVLGFACLTLVSLVKFTYFVLIAICVALIGVRRAWNGSWRAAARALALYAVVFATTWTLLGQSLLGLPRYVQRAGWIAQGYNEGMGCFGSDRETSIARAIVLLALAVVAVHVWLRPRSKAAWIAGAVLCCGMFVALKGGFVRHGGNSITFFGFAALAPFLLPASPPTRTLEHLLCNVQTAARIACTALAVYGFVIVMYRVADAPKAMVDRVFNDTVGNVSTLADLERCRTRYEDDRADLRAKFDLPQMHAKIGREHVDVMCHSQAIALLNDFDYRPRPVFQGYSAYTPELIRLNARYLESRDAPRFVILAYEPSDLRLAGSEDGLALQVMMRDYAPLLSERGFLLLERDRDPSPVHVEDERTLVFEGTAAIGETIDVGALSDERTPGMPPRRAYGRLEKPEPCIVLALDIELGTRGKLWSALVKTPPLNMRVELDDGEVLDARVVPGLMHTGVVISPYLDTQGAYVRWYCGERVRRVARFSVQASAADAHVFQRRMAVRLYRDDALSARVDPALEPSLAFPMFSQKPESISPWPGPDRSRLENIEVFTLQAPSEIAFAIAPGRHSVHAKFGVQPNAWENECTDGAGFSIVTRDASGAERVLFHRVIDKNAPGGHDRPHDVDVAFDADRATKLFLRTDGGPSGDISCDWTYWTEVRISDRAAPREPPR
jgi:hypothetical protein